MSFRSTLSILARRVTECVKSSGRRPCLPVWIAARVRDNRRGGLLLPQINGGFFRFSHRLVALCAVAVCAAMTARAEIKVGDAFPSLADAHLVPLIGDQPVTTGNVVLVDFWASWCAPCKASFPMMAKLYQD